MNTKNKKRIGTIERITSETNVRLTLNIDGSGKADISTGIGFLDHMLVLFAHHGRFDLDVKASGDVDVDLHHTVEDVGLVMGEAFKKAIFDLLNDKEKGLKLAANARAGLDKFSRERMIKELVKVLRNK